MRRPRSAESGVRRVQSGRRRDADRRTPRERASRRGARCRGSRCPGVVTRAMPEGNARARRDTRPPLGVHNSTWRTLLCAPQNCQKYAKGCNNRQKTKLIASSDKAQRIPPEKDERRDVKTHTEVRRYPESRRLRDEVSEFRSRRCANSSQPDHHWITQDKTQEAIKRPAQTCQLCVS